nr:hypothetical protein [Tanacetum cinerariifolium]
ETKEFAEWILKVGNGTLFEPNDGKAVLAPTNIVVDTINDKLLENMLGDMVEYFSSDSLCNSEPTSAISQAVLVPKILTVLKMAPTVIQARIIGSTGPEGITLIPRMRLIPSDKRMPVKMIRKQFPISVSFSMTLIRAKKGFLDNSEKKKKKKKKERVSNVLDDVTLILGGIDMRVKNIDGKTSVPKSILKKASLTMVGDSQEAAKTMNDGGSASKVRFEAVGITKPSSPTAYANGEGSKSDCSFVSLLRPHAISNKVHFRTLVNDERVEVVDCVLPKNVAAKVKSRITRNNDGVYLFKFATKAGRDQVIEKGPWMILKRRKKNKGANFCGIRLNKPKVMWQQKKGADAKSNSTSPCTSSNAIGNDQGVSNPGLNTSNPFDVLNVDGDDMGESGTQPKVSEYVSSDLNENRKEASKPSSSKSVYGDGHKDKNVSSPPVLKKWDVINEDDTTDDEDVFTSYGGSLGGGNQLEDKDFDFYGSYADQVVDLDGALKEFHDFKLSMSGRK